MFVCMHVWMFMADKYKCMTVCTRQVRVSMYVYMYECMHTYVARNAYMYACIFPGKMYVYMMFIYMHECMCVRMYLCMYAVVYVYVHVDICVCMNIYK